MVASVLVEARFDDVSEIFAIVGAFVVHLDHVDPPVPLFDEDGILSVCEEEDVEIVLDLLLSDVFAVHDELVDTGDVLHYLPHCVILLLIDGQLICDNEQLGFQVVVELTCESLESGFQVGKLLSKYKLA